MVRRRKEKESEYEYKTEFTISIPKKDTKSLFSDVVVTEL
jgi:hypothetical protein